MNIKVPGDVFSDVAEEYAKYRTGYPDELIRFILAQTPGRAAAWDCATGNGQTAKMLSPFFEKVYATDVSEEQLARAPRQDNVAYSTGAAENSGLPSESCDLIASSQAAHWFDMTAAAREFRRVAKAGAVVAFWGYSPPRFNPSIDALFDEFYFDVLGLYWDERRRLVDERYRTLHFPFREIPTLEFVHAVAFDLESFAGYLRTWSAVGAYLKANGRDPVVALVEKLKPLWQGRMRGAYPIFLRMGVVRD
jgi:ubiquinone/menaquinone biosynthesis C-methylase UbiE